VLDGLRSGATGAVSPPTSGTTLQTPRAPRHQETIMADHAADTSRADAVATLLRHFSAGDFDAAMTLLSEEIEVRLPFQDERTGFWSHVGGKRGVRQLFAGVAKLFDPHPLHLDEVFSATDGRTVVARYHGDFVARDTGKPYQNTYIAVFEFDGGLIRSWTEFHNPMVLAEALRP
jgi:ketosteroid isomerase-like protein